MPDFGALADLFTALKNLFNGTFGLVGSLADGEATLEGLNELGS